MSCTTCSHCFPVTLNNSQPNAHTIEGVHQAYIHSIRYVPSSVREGGFVCLFVCVCLARRFSTTSQMSFFSPAGAVACSCTAQPIFPPC